MRVLVVLFLKLLGTGICLVTLSAGLGFGTSVGAPRGNQSHELGYWLMQAVAFAVMGVSVLGIVFIWKRRKPAESSPRLTTK